MVMGIQTSRVVRNIERVFYGNESEIERVVVKGLGAKRETLGLHVSRVVGERKGEIQG